MCVSAGAQVSSRLCRGQRAALRTDPDVLLCLRQGLCFVDVVGLYKQQATWSSSFWGYSCVSSFLHHHRVIGTADVWSCFICVLGNQSQVPWLHSKCFTPEASSLEPGHLSLSSTFCWSFWSCIFFSYNNNWRKDHEFRQGGIWGVQRNKRGMCMV